MAPWLICYFIVTVFDIERKWLLMNNLAIILPLKSSLSGKFQRFNPIQDGVFWGCSRMRGAKSGPPSPHPFSKICHTYPTMMKLGSYTLPKEVPKTIWITWHTIGVLLTSAFFYRKLANFAISRNIPFRYIISNSFSFSRVFKDCFNKLGHNFDDVIKNGSPRPS